MSMCLTSEISEQQDKKAHPWRICPIGKHFVSEHTVHISPSKKHPKKLKKITV